MLRICVIVVLATLFGSYLGIALYLWFLPGHETVLSALQVAPVFLVDLIGPILLAGTIATIAIALVARNAGPVRLAALAGMTAAVGGAAVGYWATYKTPAIPTPLAMECMALGWLLTGVIAGVLLRKRAGEHRAADENARLKVSTAGTISACTLAPPRRRR